ncbi:MAG: hypothetical protein WCE94_04790 [Candidatus Methanoperedens sp.]
MGLDCKRIWNQSKDKLPPHQAMLTESLIKMAGSYDICWTCGDDERLYNIKVKNSDGEVTNGIMCADCIEIQKNMGTVFVEKNPIKK